MSSVGSRSYHDMRTRKPFTKSLVAISVTKEELRALVGGQLQYVPDGGAACCASILVHIAISNRVSVCVISVRMKDSEKV